MKTLQPIVISGREVLPLIEGGKGISITNGVSSGSWARSGGVGTFSGVNADSYDENGDIIPQIYEGRTRRERHWELIKYAVQGAIEQAHTAHDISDNQGRLHMNILWEMGGAEEILKRVLGGARDLIHGVTCGAGMPYRLGEICAAHKVHYYPIISSARAFRALWKRAYHKWCEWLGAVVYEDPWLAGGHNGLSNSEDPQTPEAPYHRVRALRAMMRECGLGELPIIMAGGVWYLREWEDWIDDPDLGPVAFQFGTRPLLTCESPIPEQWKQRLLDLKQGDIVLHRFSPTGFYSSAVKNDFLCELESRSKRQVAYAVEPVGELNTALTLDSRSRPYFLTAPDVEKAQSWMAKGYIKPVRTPDQTLIFVTPQKAEQIRRDQMECMGCLSACQFSNWSQNEKGSTGKKADPRSFCIQKTLQVICHQGETIDQELMFAGHGAYRFRQDPFYANGFVPTVRQLIDRILTGD